MCLNCGCMRAHDDMGKPTRTSPTRRSSGWPMPVARTVDDILATISRTADQDRRDHPNEYAVATAAGATDAH